MNLLQCEVCVGQYGERGRWPRVLQCGHTLCSLCVVHVLKRGAAMCPFCFSKHPASTPLEVPLNHIVLKILKSPLAVQTLGRMYGINQWLPSPTSGGDQWSSAGGAVSMSTCGTPGGCCRMHGPHRQFWCVTCQVSFCRDCTLSHHPAASCRVMPCAATQAMETIKKIEDESVKKSILQFDQHISRLHNQEERVKNIIKRHTDHVRQLREVIVRHHRLQRELETELGAMQLAISEGLEACVELIEAQTDLFEAKTVQQVMTARQRTRFGQTTIQNWYNPSLGQDSEYLKQSVRLQITTAECLLVMSKRDIDPKFVPERNSLSHLVTSIMEVGGAGKAATAEVDDGAGEVTDAAAEVDHRVDEVDGRAVEMDHGVPKINRRAVRMLYRDQVLDEEPNKADGEAARFDATADKVDCGVASVDGSAVGVDDRAEDVDERANVLDDRTAGVDDRTAGVDDRTAGVGDRTAGVDDRTAGVGDRTAGVDDRTGGVDDRTSGVGDRTAGVDDRIAGVDDRTAGVDDRTAGVDDRTDGLDDRTAGLDDGAAVVDDRVAGVDDRAAGVDDRAAVMDDRAAGVSNRAAIVEDRAAGVEDRAAGVEDRAAIVEDRAAGVDDRAAGVDDRAAGVDGKAAVVQRHR